MSRGSAIVEMLVLGTVAMAVVLSAAVASVRLEAAGERAEQAARAAADWAARWGDLGDAEEVARRHSPGSDVSVTRVGDRLRVTVRVRVVLVGPAGSPVAATVTGRAESVVAPYRSRR